MKQNKFISFFFEDLCEGKLKKTLQFLWRDALSKFDLNGPYFTIESGLDTCFATTCLFEVLCALGCVGFNVIGLGQALI